ncbi:MAG: ABC transporter substrate-binding protein [Elusimicrobiota bacterium]|jgi:NitT/TauT family transport system substrate-binding protein|nr:ABC transporter substrate-binding protein [Elusimicrobiota bacterium]
MKLKKFKKLSIIITFLFLITNFIDIAIAKKVDLKKYPLGATDIQALGGGACGAPSYIAYEKGFFADEGLDVTLVSGTFETQKAGLASGKYAVTNGDFQFFPSVNEGLDIKIIGGLHQGCIKLLVPKNSNITKPEDLAGKRIGVDEIGGTPMAITSVVLANANINPTTGVTWLPYPLDQLGNVAEKGEIDALAAWDPFGTLYEKQGYRVLVDIGTHPLFAGKYCCFLYASTKQIKQNPKKVAAILRAYQKAQEWIAANPEETARIIVEREYIPGEDPILTAELLKSYNYGHKNHASASNNAKEDAQYFVEQLKKTGYLPTNLDTKNFVDKLYYDVLGDDKHSIGRHK